MYAKNHRLTGVLVLVGLSLVLLTGCGAQGGRQSSDGTDKASSLSSQNANGVWGSGEISAAMPPVEGMTAADFSETSYQLFCNFCPVSQEQYGAYVAACKESGFTAEVSEFTGSSNSFYYASAQDGSLRLSLAYSPGEQKMNMVVNRSQNHTS